MARINNLNSGGGKELRKRLQSSEVATPMTSGSVTGKGRVRIASEGGLLVQGSAFTSGRQSVSGRLDGTGSFDWTGPSTLGGATTLGGNTTVSGSLNVTRSATFGGNTVIGGQLDVSAAATFAGATKVGGTLEVTGNMATKGTLDVQGETRLRAKTTVEADLEVTGNGRIKSGPVIIDRGGTWGGRIRSEGTQLDLSASNMISASAPNFAAIDVGCNKITVGGLGKFGSLDVSGAKKFVMPHPNKPGWVLHHGATESPVSGIEYWGEDVVGPDGSARVLLPDYFEQLAKPYGRAVMVTGRGFAPDWTDITGNYFTVTGKPGGRFSWLVKAARHGADFAVETEVASE